MGDSRTRSLKKKLRACGRDKPVPPEKDESWRFCEDTGGTRLSRPVFAEASEFKTEREELMKRFLLILVALCAMLVSADTYLNVTNVSCRQRYPWNGKVDIDVEVQCDDPTTNVSLYVTAKDLQHNKTLSVKTIDCADNVSTNVGELAVRAGRHRLTWDCGVDNPNVASTNVAIEVQGVLGGGLYLVIDLSDGPDANSYPISYLNQVPEGGWTDEYKTDKLVLRRIEPGTFTMGDQVHGLGMVTNITISTPFYIGVFEVTQRQWELVKGTRPSFFRNSDYYMTRPVEKVSYSTIRGSSLGAQWPRSVSVDPNSFIGELRSKIVLKEIDLPTDAQWEYAARAGTTTDFSNGVNWSWPKDDTMDLIGRYWNNGGSNYWWNGDTRIGTAKVGSFPPNKWGLYDMHGNVYEWCCDWYGDLASNVEDPVGADTGTLRVLRGGSWFEQYSGYCSSDYRNASAPNLRDKSNSDKGFRLCCVVNLSTYQSAGISSYFAVDGHIDARIAGESEKLTYSTMWNGGETATIKVGGKILATESGEGNILWDTSTERPGRITLSHTSGDETLTADFVVFDNDVEEHRGILPFGQEVVSVETNGVLMVWTNLVYTATWKADKVHLIAQDVTIPEWMALDIESGTVVKFLPGTTLTVSSNAHCNAKGVIFTHVNDDTIGGDMLFDGGATQPVVGEYAISGVVSDDETTEYRYITHNTTLTGTLNDAKRLSRGSTYRVSGTFTIANGATLTIPAGTVLKMEQNARINVSAGGRLISKGTRIAPIIITSIKDDSYGGDSNEDGDASTPAGGDWQGIWVNGTAEFEYTTMMYAGPDSERGIVQTQGSGRLMLNNCVVAHAKYDGLWNWGGFIAATNTVVMDTGWATAPYRGSQNEYVNCIFYGNNVGLCYWSHWSGNPVYKNCIFAECGLGWCETANASYTNPQFRDAVKISNSLFYNPDGYGLQTCDRVGKNGNIWGDPLFVDLANGDFRISEGSPCVDAADSSAAPGLDYFGQPRITFTGRTNDTELAEGPLADIGICEVMPRDVTSDIDIVPETVRTEKTATPGQLLFVKWEVRNQGGAPVDATWRDTVSLVSQDGREVVLGDKTTKSAIAVGGSVFCSGYFTVPAMAEGMWYPKVNVNSYHDIFEGSLTANNALVGAGSVDVCIDVVKMGDELYLHQGTTVVSAVFDGIGVLFSTDDTSGSLRIYGSMSTVESYMNSNWRAVYIGEGKYWMSLDGYDKASRFFIVFDNKAESSNIKLTLTEVSSELTIQSISISRFPCKGNTSVTVFGCGLSRVKTVSLEDGKNRVPIKDFYCDMDGSLQCRIDGSLIIPGYYQIVVSDGVSTQCSSSKIEAYTSGMGAKVTVSLDSPKTFRVGRWTVCTISYANIGDQDSPAPIINVSGSNVTFRNPENDSVTYHEQIHLVGSSSTGDASILKAGDIGTIKLMFMTKESSYDIGISFSIPGKDSVAWESLFARGDKTEDKWNEWLQAFKSTYGGVDASGFYVYVMNQVSFYSSLGIRKKCVDDIFDMAISRIEDPDKKMIVGTFLNADSIFEIGTVIRCLSLTTGNSVFGNISNRGQVVFCANEPELVFTSEKTDIDIISCTTNNPKLVNYVLKCSSRQKDENVELSDDNDTPVGIIDSKFFLWGNSLGIATINGQSEFHVGKIVNGELVSSYNRKDSSVSWERISIVQQLDESVMIAVYGHTETNSLVEILTFSTNDSVASITQDVRIKMPEYVYSPVVMLDGDKYCVFYMNEDGYILQGRNYELTDYPITKSSMKSTVQRLSSRNGFQGFLAPKTISFGQKPFLNFSGTANWYSRPLSGNACCRWRQEMEMSAESSVIILGAGIEIGYGAEMDVFAECDGKNCREPSVMLMANETAFGNMGALVITDHMKKQVNGFMGGVKRRLGQSLTKGLLKRLTRDELARIDELFSGNTLNWETGMPTFSGGGEFSSKKTYLGSFGNCVKDDWEVMGYFKGSWSVNVAAHCYSFKVVDATLKWRAGVTKGPNLKSDGKLTVRFGNLASAEIGIESKLFGGYKTVGDWKISIPDGDFIPKKYSSEIASLKTTNLGSDNPNGVESVNVEEIACVYESENGFTVGNRGLHAVAPNYVLWLEATPVDGGKDIENRLSIVKWESNGSQSKRMLSNLDVELADVVIDGDKCTAFVKESKDGVSTIYSIPGGSLNSLDPVSIGDGTGVVQLHALKTSTGYVLITCKEDEESRVLRLRHSNKGLWSDDVVVADITDSRLFDVFVDGENIVLSLSNVNGGQDVIYVTNDGVIKDKVEGAFYLRGSRATRETLSSATAFNDKLSILTSTSMDGCRENCVCGCIKYGCGCPKDCKCNGNCEEGSCKCGGGDGGNGVGSYDPNEMVGPAGLGDPETERYVKPGEWMTYTVYFENRADATAAAQEVRVTNPLSEYLDWSTFEMGEVAFNNQIDLGLSGKRNGTSEAVMKGTNTLVRTQLTLDDATGTAEWYLRIVDPTTATGWPEDVFAGFLPPNDETFRGEGHLTYRVKVRDDAPHGVRIANSASIVFDYNEPIETDPSWWNTVARTLEAGFVEPEVVVDEGGTATIAVRGGSAERETSVQVSLAYQTASAADLDLKNAKVDGATPKGGVKFPLTLTWAAGEIGAKTITIPVKADRAVENEELFTLQLANAQGMGVGDASCCTVTIRDANAAADYAAKQGKTTVRTKKGVPDCALSIACVAMDGSGEPCGFTTGQGSYYTGCKASLKATARPGWAFAGWGEVEDGVTNVVSDKASWSVAVTDDADIIAFFDRIPYVRGLAHLADRGKVTGSGYCPAGKKVTLRATANRGYVFEGWYGAKAGNAGEIDLSGQPVAKTPALIVDRTARPTKSDARQTVITEVDGSVTYFAKFITNREDIEAVSLDLDGVPLSAEDAFATNLICGVAVDWPVVSGGLSETTVKASGLPAGLKLVQDRATRAYSVVGVPTTASKVDKSDNVKPSVAKFTVTTAGRNARTFVVEIAVSPLPTWAVGSFDGAVQMGDIVGAASMTVAANGRVSGKYGLCGTNWTFSASGYTEFIDDDIETNRLFALDVMAKSGRMLRDLRIEVTPGWMADIVAYRFPDAWSMEEDARAYAESLGMSWPYDPPLECVTQEVSRINCSQANGADVADAALMLHRGIWKDRSAKSRKPMVDGLFDWWPVLEPWRNWVFDAENFPDVKMSVATSGRVSFAGKLPDGVRASSSTTAYLVPESGHPRALFIVPTTKNAAGLLDEVVCPHDDL